MGSHGFPMDFFEVKKFAIMGVFDGLSGTCMAWVAQAIPAIHWIYPFTPRMPAQSPPGL